MLQHIFLLVGIPGHKGRHIGQNRLLVQIVANHGGDKIVQSPILRQRAAGRIDNGNMSGAVGFHEMGHAAGGVLIKAQGIQHAVQHQPVNDGNPLEAPLRRAVIDLVVHDNQLLRLCHHRAGELCHIAQLKIGKRLLSLAQQHHNAALQLRIIVHNVPIQLPQQNVKTAVVAQLRHLIILRRNLPAELPGKMGIGDAVRHRQAVLHGIPFPSGAAHQIRCGNMDVNTFGRLNSHALSPKIRRRQHKLLRNFAVPQDHSVMIDIVEKDVQGVDPLNQSLL